MDLEGKVIGNRYEIIKKIGVGGMATVYKAKCNILKRYVAVKVLRDEFTTDEEFIKRFNTEAQAAASLTHPNIVSIYDVGHEDNIYYIVMELVQGKTLKDIINEDGALPWKWALNVSIQVASALEMAHKNNIVHRDIKPHNIIITEDGIAKVTDFGIAKAVSNSTITAFGTTIGSVHYFSPEHARGGYTDAKSDLYSLGVVMYEMLTGRVPFDADTPVSVALKHMQEKPVEPMKLNPTIPYAVNKIIMKAMEKDPNERYQSATEMLKDLSLALKNPDGDFVKEKNFENEYTQRITTLNDEDFSKYNKDEDEGNEEETEEPTNKMSKKKKIILTLVIILAIILIPVIGFFGAKAIMDAGVPDDIDIPNLVGKTLDEARAELEGTDIELVSTDEFNADVEAGKIVSQDPEYVEGYTIKENATINVVVSKGIETAVVRKVTGMTYEEAVAELEAANLKAERVEETSQTVEAGIVIRQEPEADAEVNAGDTVKVYVSIGTGIEQVEVENVVGKTEQEAVAILRDRLGFEVNVGYRDDSSEETGVVLSQDVSGGSKIDEGSTINIVVNSYEPTKEATVIVNLREITGGYDETDTTLTNADKQVKIELQVDDVTTYTSSTADKNDEEYSITVEGKGEIKVTIKVSDENREYGSRTRTLDLNSATSLTIEK